MYRQKLLKKLEKLDAKSFELFKELKVYKEEDMGHKPSSQVWSPLQILEHLLISEKLSLAYCKKKLSFEPKLKKRNLKTMANDALVSLYLKTPIKFKAPKAVSTDQFTEGITLVDIEREWKTTRDDIRKFLEEVPDKYLETEVYKHPFGFRMSLGGMLNFYNAHFDRHRRQLKGRLS